MVFIIHHCIDPTNFKNVNDYESSKEIWKIFEKAYANVDKVKNVRLKTHKIKYELFHMELNGGMSELFTTFKMLIIQIKNYGEIDIDRSKVEKIMRSLSSKFDHVTLVKNNQIICVNDVTP